MPIRPYFELTPKRTPTLAAWLVKACLAADELSCSNDLGSRAHGSDLGAALGQFAAALPRSTCPAILRALVEVPVDCVSRDSTLHCVIDSLSYPISSSQTFDDAKRSARRIIEAAL